MIEITMPESLLSYRHMHEVPVNLIFFMPKVSQI